MRKIFAMLVAVVMALSLCVLMAMPVSAAETYGYMGETEQYGSGQIEFTHHSYSTFQLEIPLYADTSMANYIYASNPNLEDGYQIEIYVTNLNEDGTISMTHSSGEVAGMQLYNESDVLFLSYQNPLLATFGTNDFDDTLTATSIFWIQGGDSYNMRAGDYTGTICYRIECNPVTS